MKYAHNGQFKGKRGFFQVAKKETNEIVMTSSGESWYYRYKCLLLLR